MRRFNPLLCASVLVGVSVPAEAGTHGWGQASSIGRDVLVAAALGIPTAQRDWSGGLQAGGSILLGTGLASGLKHVFPEERPDHSDRRSFPSGHSATSFAAAASLEKRYGWKVGIPAFAIASFVGASRVEARKHHWYDVVTGAAIGTGSGLVLTRRHDANVHLTPWGDTRGGGIAVAMQF